MTLTAQGQGQAGFHCKRINRLSVRPNTQQEHAHEQQAEASPNFCNAWQQEFLTRCELMRGQPQAICPCKILPLSISRGAGASWLHTAVCGS